MTSLTRSQADALAALVHELRPDWGIPGILKALADARDRGTPSEISIAAIHAASDLTNRTPAVIPLPGAHWVKGKALGTATTSTRARCTVIGHQSYYADNCGACLVDGLDSSETAYTRTPAVPTERVRAILSTIPTGENA